MSENLQLVETRAATPAPQISFSNEQVQLIKNTIAKGASDDELSLFMNIATRTGLDPFARQIFYIKRWDAQAGREVGQPQTSIDGYRLIAERTGCYCPGPETEFSLGIDGFLLSATAFIKKWVRGEWHVVSATAFWDEYAQKKKDGSFTAMWHRMPRTMLAKCAESLALRKAFPAELSGLYTREEMMQAESEYEPPPPPKPTKPSPPKPEQSEPMTPVAQIIEKELKVLEAEFVDVPTEMPREEFVAAIAAVKTTMPPWLFRKVVQEFVQVEDYQPGDELDAIERDRAPMLRKLRDEAKFFIEKDQRAEDRKTSTTFWKRVGELNAGRDFGMTLMQKWTNGKDIDWTSAQAEMERSVNGAMAA